MRRLLIALLLSAALLAPAPAPAQIGLGIGIGADPFGGRRFENIRIGAVARGIIEDYLAAELGRLCVGKKEPPAVCAEQRPSYKSAFLPERGVRLPDAVLNKIGFVYPGTDYRQIGLSVYLIRLPDRRIHDVVSLWSDGWE